MKLRTYFLACRKHTSNINRKFPHSSPSGKIPPVDSPNEVVSFQRFSLMGE